MSFNGLIPEKAGVYRGASSFIGEAWDLIVIVAGLPPFLSVGAVYSVIDDAPQMRDFEDIFFGEYLAPYYQETPADERPLETPKELHNILKDRRETPS